MPKRPTAPPFTVNVQAGFIGDGLWLIIAELRFRDGTPPDGSELLGLGRLGVLQGIAVAGLEGRKLGAIEARVVLDTPDGVRVVTPGAEPEALH